MSHIAQFVQHCVQYSRTLPLRDDVPYLRTLCQLLGDIPEAAPVREAAIRLADSDQQLQLIARP